MSGSLLCKGDFLWSPSPAVAGGISHAGYPRECGSEAVIHPGMYNKTGILRHALLTPKENLGWGDEKPLKKNISVAWEGSTSTISRLQQGPLKESPREAAMVNYFCPQAIFTVLTNGGFEHRK